MVSMGNNIGILREYGGFNEMDKLEGGLRDQGETKNELHKIPKKDQPNPSDLSDTQSLLKMESKFEIKYY